MLGSLWDNHHITSFDLLLFASNDSLADTGGEDEVLVDSVDLCVSKGQGCRPETEFARQGPHVGPDGNEGRSGELANRLHRSGLNARACPQSWGKGDPRHDPAEGH
jgi:hypothetical protein